MDWQMYNIIKAAVVPKVDTNYEAICEILRSTCSETNHYIMERHKLHEYRQELGETSNQPVNRIKF